ncbi:MAG: aminotransferase class III-fold pyridoxal phosphate-dependent enzyme, partial [Burkholderiales bacterium]
GDQIACIIVEPVAGNMNLLVPDLEFLQTLRELCSKHGAVLIFDEVMTGFRVGPRGAQGHFNITPDITTLGKIIGGGLPVGAFGGRRDIMAKLAPLGPVYQAGTLSGNPVAVTAGLATLRILQRDPSIYARLEANTRDILQSISEVAKQAAVPFSTASAGSMFGLFFRAAVPRTFAEMMECDKDRFNKFFHSMLQSGIYLAPSAFEAGFVSAEHGAKEIEQTIAAAKQAFEA